MSGSPSRGKTRGLVGARLGQLPPDRGGRCPRNSGIKIPTLRVAGRAQGLCTLPMGHIHRTFCGLPVSTAPFSALQFPWRDLTPDLGLLVDPWDAREPT